MLLFLKEFWTTNFRFFVSKDKKYYFDDDSKVYNCLIYDKKTLSNGRAYLKNGKYYVNIVVPPKAKEFAVKNGYRITIDEEIMH